ncbi:MAG: cytochrome c [Bryobacteraceae bacterium]
MHRQTSARVAGGLFLIILAISAQTPKTESPETTHLIDSIQGPALYTAYCAVCHGKDGKGGGPMAKSLRTALPDLTRISMHEGGKFPLARIQRIISGEEPLPSGHGTRDMPVWGPIFSQVAWDQDLGRVRVYNLARYLERLQSK